MLNFVLLEKWEYILSHFIYDFFKKKSFTCYALLTDQISLPDCLYFLRYWSICVLHAFFEITQNSRRNLSILRTRRAFKMK